jgi:hypothetical protein
MENSLRLYRSKRQEPEFLRIQQRQRTVSSLTIPFWKKGDLAFSAQRIITSEHCKVHTRPKHSFPTYLTMLPLNIPIVIFSLFFGSTAHLSHGSRAMAMQVNTDVSQPFSWAGSSGDLKINLWLVHDRDSVYARGSYTVAPSKRVGCGGETLADKGLVTMRAKGSFTSFSGKLLFDSGWTPPFRASRTSSTTMSGSISSVDRGPCRLTLHRVIPPVRRGPPRP